MSDTEKAKFITERQKQVDEYKNKLAEERKKNKTERIKIKSASDSANGFELESGKVKAKLEGANFSYNQESGQVLLTTPSGVEHVLTHLPDEAIAQMSAKGFFIDSQSDVKINTTTDGQVQYTVPTKKAKKFLGLFNRQVEAQLVLDDATGDVSVEEVTPTEFWSNFFNRFTF